jgi:hypothetical protein
VRSIPVWYKGEIAARALVDNQDFEKTSEHVWYLVVTGLYQKQYYAKAQVKEANGKWRSVWMHRYILGLPPRTPMVDHIDRSGLNNTRENLRLVTTSENNQNARPGLQANKTSRYRGVCWLKRQQRWLATVCVNGKDVFKRTFVTEDEAAEAVANARAYYMPFSEEARTRKNVSNPQPPEKPPGFCYWNKTKQRWLVRIQRSGTLLLSKNCRTEPEAQAALAEARARLMPFSQEALALRRSA